jgi:hypothetical protein
MELHFSFNYHLCLNTIRIVINKISPARDGNCLKLKKNAVDEDKPTKVVAKLFGARSV